MKRFIAFMLSLMMLFSLVGCGSSTTPATEADPTAEDSSTQAVESGTVAAYNTVDSSVELPHFDILVAFTSFTEPLGIEYKNAIDYLCGLLNCTPTYLEIGYYSEETLSMMQSALVNHYDFAILPMVNTGIAKVFEDAGVPFVSFAGKTADEELAKALADQSTFLGYISINDYDSLVEGATALYENGCSNVMWAGVPYGRSFAHDQRTFGFEDTCKELGMNILTECFDLTGWPEGISAAAASYPELDGIGCTSVNEKIINTIITEGLQDQVKVVGTGIAPSTAQAFEDGFLVYTCDGNYVTVMMAFAVGYNYVLDGTRIIPAGEDAVWNVIHIHNIDEFNEYKKYFTGDVLCYTAQEVLEMTHYYNNDFTAEDFAALGEAFSLEDVIERHKDFVNP